MSRPLQRPSAVPLETRGWAARRPNRHVRRGVPLREGTWDKHPPLSTVDMLNEVAGARVAPPDEGDDGALFMTGPEGESEEDVWAGAGLDEGEPEVHEARTEAGLPSQRSNPRRVVTLKHSVSVEAQVKALQEEAAAENDYIDRAMQTLGMRQHAEQMENVLCAVGKGARAVSAMLTQKGGAYGLHAGSQSIPGHEADAHGHLQL